MSRKWVIIGGLGILAVLGVAVAGLLAFLWFFGIPLELGSGASRTLTSREFKTSMAFSPDWHMLAVGTLEDGMQMWDADSNKLLYHLDPGRVNSVAFSPDGQTVALTWKSLDEKKHQV